MFVIKICVISILFHNNIPISFPNQKETHPFYSLFIFSSLVFFLHLNQVEICLNQLDILTVAFTESCNRPSWLWSKFCPNFVRLLRLKIEVQWSRQFQVVLNCGSLVGMCFKGVSCHCLNWSSKILIFTFTV